MCVYTYKYVAYDMNFITDLELIIIRNVAYKFVRGFFAAVFHRLLQVF